MINCLGLVSVCTSRLPLLTYFSMEGFPYFLAFFITITLDMYLSIKAYQVYKKVQKENGEDKQVVKDNLNQMYRQLKPMITLLVNILGSTIVAVIVVITYHYASMISEGPSVLKHIILPNLPYLNMLLHPRYMVCTSGKFVSHWAGGWSAWCEVANLIKKQILFHLIKLPMSDQYKELGYVTRHINS